MSNPVLPRIPDVVEEAENRLIDKRPSASLHVKDGRWGDVIAQWKAQHALVLRRISYEVSAARLWIAEGRELYDLVVSEFGATIPPDPSHAIGHVVLSRDPPHTGERLVGGLIRAGTRFRKVPNPSASPPVAGAEYESTAPVFVQPFETPTKQEVRVRIRCVNPGTGGNAQDWEEDTFALADTLFDPSLRVVSGQAAGGMMAYSPAKLRALATAMTMGQYGPVSSALVAGALSTQGVSRCVSRSGAKESIWITDDSWCCSDELLGEADKTIRDAWLGFGCRYSIFPVKNVRVSLKADVLLRGERHIADAVDVSAAIRAAVKRYFDDRPDFYIWKTSALRGVITQSDRRILSCLSVVVSDADGNPIPDPDGLDVKHYDIDTTNACFEFFAP